MAIDMKPNKFEYLDHTSDVQLHSWGDNLKEAMANLVLAMYCYMVEDVNQIENVYSMEFEVSGEDTNSLVFNLLQECLYNFTAEPFFVANRVSVKELDRSGGKLTLVCEGESFDLKKHNPGTEVKAITYSALQVLQVDSRYDIFVVVDI